MRTTGKQKESEKGEDLETEGARRDKKPKRDKLKSDYKSLAKVYLIRTVSAFLA